MPSSYYLTSNTETITTTGSSQVIIPVGELKFGFEIQNQSTADLWLNIGGTAGVNSGFKIPAGASYSLPDRTAVRQGVSIFGATAGLKATLITY
jgi:hypothetical protein